MKKYYGINCCLKRMTAHILSYRRIRRYLALSPKATEEHATLVM